MYSLDTRTKERESEGKVSVDSNNLKDSFNKKRV